MKEYTSKTGLINDGIGMRTITMTLNKVSVNSIVIINDRIPSLKKKMKSIIKKIIIF